MQFLPWDVTTEVARRQVRRYREMTATEKLACADALWDVAWAATRAGVRMRHPEYNESEVTNAARRQIANAPE